MNTLYYPKFVYNHWGNVKAPVDIRMLYLLNKTQWVKVASYNEHPVLS
jgi:hypothetical protein